MIGEYNPFNGENNILRNEIAFANLISIANSPKIFDTLDNETQEALVNILGAYTRANVDVIMNRREEPNGFGKEVGTIRSHIR